MFVKPVPRFLFLSPVEEWIFRLSAAVVFNGTLSLTPGGQRILLHELLSYYVMIAGVGWRFSFGTENSFGITSPFLSLWSSMVAFGVHLLTCGRPPAFYMEIPRFVDQHRFLIIPLNFRRELHPVLSLI